MSVSPAPSSTTAPMASGNATALPPDLAPRPSSGPQPPVGQPFFFNPTHTDDSGVCYFSIQTAENDKATLNATEMALARSTGERCCSGVGIWHDILFACRTESQNGTKAFETCANGTLHAGCTGFKGYQANVEWLFWMEAKWPEAFDNNTHWITTAFGARDSNGTVGNGTATNGMAGDGTNPTISNSTSTAERCCAQAKGTYIHSLSNSTHQKRYSESFGEYNRTMFPPCLIPKEQADSYKQCVLDTAPNALVMAESWQYNSTSYNRVRTPPGQGSAAPATRKLGVGFAVLAASMALLGSLA
ncbi:hypothetical protein A1Q2_04618 [Trichosporon asahii var. asahii CBS 8904]|uniref:Uncharacterized protein n=2 Tax=Trichosporon asahii var. asahii TaxID=189963 RepID=K1VAR9_TRIAC|nr:hypothetical protein A1Q1_00539 [Trichosporon asahii var. asahii CBS 2479]EJT50238.1 hypothetical protein A1Q1_00539 [Trichosporon asahii var. asahii CBS 2479]EKD01120.1 hypothetical protein A1Q2_04618 [Trichosporon asahii var. asahii CBS 8904]